MPGAGASFVSSALLLCVLLLVVPGGHALVARAPTHAATREEVSWSVLPLQTYSEGRHVREVAAWTSVGVDRRAPTATSARLPLDPDADLRVVYVDDDLVVLHKPSGVLSVPGPKRNPSLADLAFRYFGGDDSDNSNDSDSRKKQEEDEHPSSQLLRDVDNMVVHRLDMDTSGIIVYARTYRSLRALHAAFRDRAVKKTYEAVVCGHLPAGSDEGEIDLPLQRDHVRSPFMRVSTVPSELERQALVERYDNNGDKDNGTVTTTDHAVPTTDIEQRLQAGYGKFLSKDPKASLTHYQVLSREEYHGLPVTRLLLYPVTGRTHQLRVHCAAIGHPILSDQIYGYDGIGTANGGIPIAEGEEEEERIATGAGAELQREMKKITERNGLRLCLHAKELRIFHPYTGAPLVLRCEASFYE